jgi:hypothetical protein
MFLIADAPAGRVIGLRSVTQLMAQRNLLNCPIILDLIIANQVTLGFLAGVILPIIALKEKG